MENIISYHIRCQNSTFSVKTRKKSSQHFSMFSNISMFLSFSMFFNSILTFLTKNILVVMIGESVVVIVVVVVVAVGTLMVAVILLRTLYIKVVTKVVLKILLSEYPFWAELLAVTSDCLFRSGLQVMGQRILPSLKKISQHSPVTVVHINGARHICEAAPRPNCKSNLSSIIFWFIKYQNVTYQVRLQLHPHMKLKTMQFLQVQELQEPVSVMSE